MHLDSILLLHVLHVFCHLSVICVNSIKSITWVKEWSTVWNLLAEFYKWLNYLHQLIPADPDNQHNCLSTKIHKLCFQCYDRFQEVALKFCICCFQHMIHMHCSGSETWWSTWKSRMKMETLFYKRLEHNLNGELAVKITPECFQHRLPFLTVLYGKCLMCLDLSLPCAMSVCGQQKVCHQDIV